MKKNCFFFGHKIGKSDRRDWDNKCPDCGEYWDDDKFRYTFWRSETWDYVKAALLVFAGSLLIFLCIFLLIAVPNAFIQKATCTKYTEMGIKTMWNYWTGCMAYSEKFGWLPVAEFFKTLNLNIP